MKLRLMTLQGRAAGEIRPNSRCTLVQKPVSILFFLFLFFSILPLGAEHLAFPQPIPVVDYTNLRSEAFSKSCPNGNFLIAYKKNHLGEILHHLQLIGLNNETLWDEPLIIRDLANIIMRDDNTFTIMRRMDIIHDDFILDTYDQNKTKIAHLSDISFFIDNEYLQTFADHLGGLYLICSSGQVLKIYYFDNAGNLSLKQNLQDNYEYRLPQHIFTSDGGLLLTFCLSNEIRILKLDANHQLIWTREHPIMYAAGHQIQKRSDGTFYIAWRTYTNLYVQIMDENGDFLWDQPWEKTSFNSLGIAALSLTSDGNLILHSTEGDTHFKYHLNIISPAGSTLHTDTYVDYDTPYNRSYWSSVVPDSAGGWFFITCPTYGYNNALFIFHYDNQYQSWSQPLSLPTYYSPIPHYCARLNGENLDIVHLAMPDEDLGKYFTALSIQKIDTEANLLYAGSGLQIESGVNSAVDWIRYKKLNDDSLFAAWCEDDRSIIKYQIIFPDGTRRYPQPQSFTLAHAGRSAFELIETDAGEILIIRLGQSTNYIQKLNLDSGAMWENGGKAIPGAKYSYYDGSLYMANVYASSVYVQRYDDGESVWGGDGIMVGGINLDYQGYGIELLSFTKNFLTWSQIDSNNDYMNFYNIILGDGSSLYPPDDAPALVPLFGNYTYCRVLGVYPFSEGFSVRVRLYYWETLANGHWALRETTLFLILDALGGQVYDPVEISHGFELRLLHENELYYAYFHAGVNSFHKYNLIDGTGWQTALPFMIIQNQCLLDDGRILWYAFETDHSNQCFPGYYGFIDTSGNLIRPADSYISNLECDGVFCTDNGAYFTLMGSGRIPYLQFLSLSSGIPGSGAHSPALSLGLFNYPNPFNPTTNISFKLPCAAHTKLEIYNLRGQKVATLLDDYLPKGEVVQVWGGEDDTGKPLPSGVYFCRVKAGKKVEIRKMLLMK